MPNAVKLAVTPPPICKSAALRAEILRLFPQTTFNSSGRYLQPGELTAFLRDASAAIVGRERVDGQTLDQLPRLRMIAKYGVGLDNIDQAALAARGIALGWTGGVNKTSVAELTLCFMLGLCHNVFSGGYALKQGNWDKDGGIQLTGKTIGIIGCGHVGKEVARLLLPYHCRILVRDILDMSGFCQSIGAAPCSLDDALTQADIVTLHVPLTADTRHMIDAAALARMRRSAFLVNASRGGVVDQAALKTALLSGAIAGAALDVFAVEPPDDMELLACPSLMVTPHIGGNTVEAVAAMARSAFRHVTDFFDAAGKSAK